MHLKSEQISIQGKRIPYGKEQQTKKDRILQINRVDSSVLRNTSTRALFPREFVEVRDVKLKYVTEYLQELLSLVFGDFIQEGFLTNTADDFYIGADTMTELKQRWFQVLKRLQDNNLTLSATKTLTRSVILGWIWSLGTLAVSLHKIAPLVSVEPPNTCSAMRSFIGAYKALARCIPNYSSLMSPLEDSIKGMHGSQVIQWSDDLHAQFKSTKVFMYSTDINHTNALPINLC